MTPVKEGRRLAAEQLRQAVYRGIRQILDRSTVHLPRAAVVQILAAMAAEQAAIIAADEHSGTD